MGLHKFILLNYCLRTGAFRKCPRTRVRKRGGGEQNNNISESKSQKVK